MGDEGVEGSLDEEREHIRQLQSEQARKLESFQRLQQKSNALKEELGQRKNDLADLVQEHTKEVQKASKAKDGAAGHKKEAAISSFMQEQVLRMLQERIPVMVDIDEEDEHDAAAALLNSETPQEEGAATLDARIHDTVLVTYVNFQPDGKTEEYHVTIRIDRETTVDQLHREACDYWGCSVRDFALYMEKSAQKHGQTHSGLEQLEVTRKLAEDVLDPSKESHVWLLQEGHITRHSDEMKKRTESDAKMQRAKEAEEGEEGRAAKAAKGSISAAAAGETEAFVEALKPWPGVYHLLKTRRRQRDRRDKIIKFRDIVIYGALALISGICLSCRYTTFFYTISEGVRLTLVDEIHKSGVNEIGAQILAEPGYVAFESIRTNADIWAWMKNTFSKQIFNENSTLREFYIPTGMLRIRQQKVKVRSKCDRELPYFVEQKCHYTVMTEDTQQKEFLIFKEGEFINMSETSSGRFTWPDPKVWTGRQDYDQEVSGKMSTYDGSGYMLDYNLASDQIENAGRSLMADLPKLELDWVTGETRMITIDLVVGNFNLHGLLALTFLLEISPTGAIVPTFTAYPFQVGRTDMDNVAEVFDYFRGFIIVFYVLVIRVYVETRRKAIQGKRSWTYLFSFSGFIDQSTVSVFILLKVVRWKYESTPSPFGMTGHMLYSKDGYIYSRLFVVEAYVFLLICVRFATFMRIFGPIHQFWKMFQRSLRMFTYFLAIFLPVIAGIVFLANSIWHSQFYELGTWSGSFLWTLHSIRHHLPVQEMFDKDKVATMCFVAYFFLSMTLFFINGFLAITVHAYFEVVILESDQEVWPKERWLEWMLWRPIYKMVVDDDGGDEDMGDGMEDEGEEGEDEDDDPDGK